MARQIQRDMGDIFMREGADIIAGTMVSVTQVRMSPDLSFAKIYISVFPFGCSEQIASRLEAENWRLRKALGTRIKHQLRQVPEIAFYIDDSMEYAQNIDNLLKEA